jgi:hypothetical protein
MSSSIFNFISTVSIGTYCTVPVGYCRNETLSHWRPEGPNLAIRVDFEVQMEGFEFCTQTRM